MKRQRSLNLPGILLCIGLAFACAAAARAKPKEPAADQGAGNVQFTGGTKFPEKTLRAAISDQLEGIRDSGLNPASADDAAFFLGVFYRKNGYAQADVKWEIAAANRLVLKISEGLPTSIGGVTIRGNQSFPEAALRDYILGPTRERFPRVKEIPFVEADVATGVERVRGHYASEGFADAVVEPAQITYSADRTKAFVSVSIQEGRRYKFGKVNFSGDLIFYPQTELMKQLEPFLKKPYTRFQITNIQRAAIYYYKQHGYFDPKVTIASEPAMAAKDGSVPVNIHIDSGGFYRFDGIEVSGLDRLRRSFLEHRFGRLSGKFYNPDKLDEVFREMMRTGLFKTLRTEPEPLPDSTVKLKLTVTEAKAKELGASFGYGTFEGFILGFTAVERDLFGTGRPIGADVEFSQRLLRGDVTFTDPWFLESEFKLQVRLYALSIDYDGYSKIESGLRIELSRKIAKHVELSAFALTRVVNLQNTGIDEDAIGQASYRASSIGATQTLDFRDSIINPGRGWVMNATEEFAASVLGSSVDLVRGTARFAYYLPIKKSLLAFGARAGILVPLAGENAIPIDERFFNGGSRSVRSFVERDLGPKDSQGKPVGGETFTTFNIEYEFPIWGDLHGAIFADAGSVGPRQSEGFGLMRYALGGGLRYRLPVGPLRIDYGYNPDRRPNEDTGAFNLSFGVAF